MAWPCKGGAAAAGGGHSRGGAHSQGGERPAEAHASCNGWFCVVFEGVSDGNGGLSVARQAGLAIHQSCWNPFDRLVHRLEGRIKPAKTTRAAKARGRLVAFSALFTA